MVITYENNPVWALKSGANTANCDLCKVDVAAGSMVARDFETGDLVVFKISAATCELTETPTASSLHVYTDSGKETELVEDTDFTVDGKDIDVLRRDLYEIYCEYSYTSGESTASKTETLTLNFTINGDCQGIALNDHVGDAQEVAYAIGGFVKRGNVLNLSPVAEGYIPRAITLID